MFSVPGPRFFTKSLGSKIYADIEEWDGGAQHTPILTENGSAIRIHFLVLKVDAIAQTLPVVAFHLLDIGRLANNEATEDQHTQKNQVSPPQYVLLYFQSA
jgi:hypothetical protein